mgnify:CR=1 FL=1
MIGITAYGGYVPRLRLSRQAVAQANAWYVPQFARAKGTRAYANWDEDSLTMAVAAARENIARLALPGAAAEASDALEAAAGRAYDLVVSNPPFHAGKAVDTAMAEAFFAQARALLAPGGRLLLVANRFLPYERHLRAHFRRVEAVAQSSSYKILAARP